MHQKEEELKRWRKLQNGINRIFQDLHSVMNYLSDDDHKQDDVFHVSLAEHIQATLSESDRRLHDKGFLRSFISSRCIQRNVELVESNNR